MPRILADLAGLGVSRATITRLTVLTLLFAVSEGVGLGMLVPIAAYASGMGRDASATGIMKDLEALLSGFLGTSDADLILAGLLLMAAVPFGLRVWLFYRREIHLAALKEEISRAVRRRLITALMQADLGFLGNRSQGELQALVTVEADRAVEAVAGKVAFLTASALSITYSVLLVAVSPQLALYAAPVFALTGLLLRHHGRKADRTSRRLSEQNTALGEQLSDGIFGIERIKLRAREAEAIAELTGVTDRIARNMKQGDRLRALIQVRTEPLLVMSVFVIVYLAIAKVGMGFAALGIFLLVITRLVPQTLAMSQQWAQMRVYNGSLERLRTFLGDAGAHREAACGDRRFKDLHAAIRLDAVGFRYSSRDTRGAALAGLSLAIPARRTTAVVGRSGAGKTTLIRLLTGCYRPTEGGIFFDDVPLQDIDRTTLRRRIGVVAQKPFFFGTSLRENLTFGIDPSPSDGRIHEALRLCHCEDFVAGLPDGLETDVGSHGARFSEGQRQRLAIAHALLIDPTLLIMDEPTAALDSESERAIQTTLAALSGRITVIVIAHRLSTIQHADTILVMDQGRLLAQGTHTALLRDSSLYRTLFDQNSS
ncbi:ABC transporter ATP-binding protein [Thiocapsa marina]|uniref:Xenobiotic-transporting ATPase n=1 Tax=Thiocapsa marina 5811 TaxID=768671 RepID=F9U9B9_9GAMM|nr:ABC transporter ATP-binding protein [Thiocapsa marina]EGV19377.1 Xenobiotic-transporting ATPase [Thiocapsa marina 5811]